LFLLTCNQQFSLYRKDKPKPVEENDNSQNDIRANALYISADEVDEFKSKEMETNNDCLMEVHSNNAIVQNTEANNEMEIQNNAQPQGAIYAVVNIKKRKKEELKIKILVHPIKMRRV